MLRSLTTPQLVQLIANNAGLEFDAAARSTLDLVQIAANAAKANVRVTLIGCANRPVAELVQIAANGKGSVTFKDE